MIFLFIDGFGIGEKDRKRNPLSNARIPNIINIVKNYNVIHVDASLGVSGLPQSATGQTAIFTGINASCIMGRHLSGQPGTTLKKVINKNNLFKELIGMGLKVTNSNVYRQKYLTGMLNGSDRRLRPSVTSVMCISAGVSFRTIEDYRRGDGIYHDIIGNILTETEKDLQVITPEEAAQRLHNISRRYDFTLFEHFMTDIVGHMVDMKRSVEQIELLDSFIGALFDLIDPERDILFICSDHGNIEDSSIKTHTFNKVPVIVTGDIPERLTAQIKSLTDITPTVLDIFKYLKK